MTDAGQRHLECVERAGPDVAEHDAERGQCQKPGAAGMMEVFGLVGGDLRLARNNMRRRTIDQAADRGTRWYIHVRLPTALCALASSGIQDLGHVTQLRRLEDAIPEWPARRRNSRLRSCESDRIAARQRNDAMCQEATWQHGRSAMLTPA